MASVEVMDCFLVDYDQITKTAVVHFCVWSEALDAHVIPVVQYSPKRGVELVHSSGIPEADYWVVNSEDCLRDVRDLVEDQYQINERMN